MGVIKRHKRGSFNGATPTNAAEASDYRAKVYDSLCEIDTYETHEFTVRVVSDVRVMSNQPIINASMSPEGRRIIDSSKAFVQIKFRGQLVASDILVPHLLLPDLCDLSVNANNVVDTVNYSTMYIDCISPDAYDGEMPSYGDLVKVILRPGDVGPVDCQTCYFDKIQVLSSTESNSIRRSRPEAKNCSELAGAFASAAALAGTGGPAKVNSDMARLLAEGEEAPEGKMIESQLNAQETLRLVTEVVRQYDFWKNTDESKALGPEGTLSPEYLTLYKYWVTTLLTSPDNYAAADVPARARAGIYSASGGVTHWSAVYISYIMINCFGGVGRGRKRFASSTAHYYYLTGSKNLQSQWRWKSYKLLNSRGKIKAQVGDILITVYNGAARETPNTHGDVVYKVADGFAYLSGGNVGNSVTVSRVVKVDAEGFYKTSKQALTSPRVPYPYVTVMKYRAKESNYGPAALASSN